VSRIGSGQYRGFELAMYSTAHSLVAVMSAYLLKFWLVIKSRGKEVKEKLHVELSRSLSRHAMLFRRY